MYTNAGYLNNDETNLEGLIHPLRINSRGVYRLISRSSMFTLRQNGRRDYQPPCRGRRKEEQPDLQKNNRKIPRQISEKQLPLRPILFLYVSYNYDRITSTL